jgi:hypothetical protein
MLNLELSHQELFHKWWSWEEKIAVGSTSNAPEGIAFVSWDALVRSEREQLRRLCEAAMSLSSVQQAQLPCARSNSFLDHKSKTSRSSTTTWRRGRSTRTSLLLRVCVHPQFHFTHRQLLQCTSLLPRAHRIETEAALRDHGNCKLSCFVPLCVSVYCLLLKVLVGCLAKNFYLISSEPNRKIGHILWKTQYLIVASM